MPSSGFSSNAVTKPPKPSAHTKARSGRTATHMVEKAGADTETSGALPRPNRFRKPTPADGKVGGRPLARLRDHVTSLPTVPRFSAAGKVHPRAPRSG